MRPPLARTNAEAHLYMELTPCEVCGERGFSGTSAMVLVDGELCSRHAGPCRRCLATRTFTFRLPEEIRLPLAEDVVFGGSDPSELLDPGEWLNVADLAARVAPEPEPSDLALAASALDEILKFIPDGTDEVPPEVLRTEDGREVYHREPGRFRRVRLAAVAATYRDLAQQARRAAQSDGAQSDGAQPGGAQPGGAQPEDGSGRTE